MSTNVTFNGNVYAIPAVGEDDYGQNLTDYFIAIPAGALQKSGGNFVITADVNFGANYGLLAKYFAARSGAATDGLVRLSNLDKISWRNNANDGNLILAVNASDELTYEGATLTFGGLTGITGDVVATGPGSAVATIQPLTITTGKLVDNSATNSKLADVPTLTFKGRITASTGDPEDLTATQATSILNPMVGDSGAGGTKGLVPAPAAGDAASLKFLKADGTWQVPAGGGGGVTPVTFNFANNQVAPADVTGFLVPPGTYTGFSSAMSVRRQNQTSTPVADGVVNALFQTNAGAGFAGGTSTVYDSAIQADGSIVYVGDFTSYNGISCKNICRVSSVGAFDTAFNTNIGTGPNGALRCVRIQGDGKIVVGGSPTIWNGTAVGRLVRLSSAGVLESAFGNAGPAVYVYNNTIRTVNFLSTNQIVVGGLFTSLTDGVTPVTAPRWALLTSAGVPDPSFTPGAGFTNIVCDVAVDGSDNLYWVGAFQQYNGVNARLAVRTNSAGTTISGYSAVGTGNAFSIELPLLNRIRILSDGSAAAVGMYFKTTSNLIPCGVVWKWDNTGAADTTFNGNVLTTTDTDFGTGVAATAALKVFVGGVFVGHFYRLNSNGTSDTTFATTIGTSINTGSVETIELAASSAAYLAGSGFTSFNGNAISPRVLLLGGAEIADFEYYLETQLNGVYKPFSTVWDLAYGASVGVPTGVVFSMTAGGQLQYTSSNLTGLVSLNQMRFIILGL